MKIDRNELDNYLTQEPPEHGPEANWEYWIDEWKAFWYDAKFELGRLARSVLQQLVRICPDCHKPTDILWFNVGNHEDCFPF